MIDLQLGDCVEWAKNYRGEKFHALLTDCPYELNFMNRKWDSSGVSTRKETWEAFASVLHDGAFEMTFAGSRTYHRIACAIEDAGLIIHPVIMAWTFGSGFPKSTRVKGAKEFEGHRYGLQCLKPALEPIIVFQKPYRGKPVDCITRTGAGALWIDGARIGYQSEADKEKNVDGLSRFNSTSGKSGAFMASDSIKPNIESTALGRWGSNFVLTCAPSCNGTHADDCPASLLDEQSGERPSGNFPRVQNTTSWKMSSKGKELADAHSTDSGGASRYFFRAQWDALEAADPVRYCAKASRRERDAGLDDLPIKLFAQSGGAQAALARGDIEYQEGESVTTGMNVVKQVRNPHPTVKPIALARYLATLLLPPPEYAPRRLFVPFAGVASECIGAHQAGWDEIVGVEREQEYIDIGNARVKYWTIQMDFLSK